MCETALAESWQAEQTAERDQEQQQGAMACVQVIGDDQHP